MSMRICILLILGLGLIVPLTGCKKKFPPIVPTEGTVLLDGKPLANVSVTFIPLLDDFGAESCSTGVTDAAGHFVLTCQYNKQPGAAVGQHIVIVTDAPLPEEMRKVQDSRKIDAYRAKSGNRPIPPQYSSFSKSPLKIEVKEGQGDLTVTMSR